jgi:hypothetical protein
MPPLQVPLQGHPLVIQLVIAKFPFTLIFTNVFSNNLNQFDVMYCLHAFLE